MSDGFSLIRDIPSFSEWSQITELHGGNSKEFKFRLQNASEQLCTLRVTSIDRFHLEQQEYANLTRLEPFHLPMPKPLQFGLCNGGNHLYMLLSWIEGNTVSDLLTTAAESEQYNLGLKAGVLLARLHQLSPVASPLDWNRHYTEIEDGILSRYWISGIVLRNEASGIDYLRNKKKLLDGRPLVIKHGDYHAANLILTPESTMAMIDFDRCVISDPYEEFAILVWTAAKHPAFARGQIAGYFNGHAPADFFPLLAYYITVYAFEHVTWALGYGKNSSAVIKKTAEDLLDLFDGYQRILPRWYTDPDA